MAYQRTCELPDVQFFLTSLLEEYIRRPINMMTLSEIKQRVLKEFRDIKAAGVLFIDDGSLIKDVVFEWSCWAISRNAEIAFDNRYHHMGRPFKPEFTVSFIRFDNTPPGLPWVFSIG